jgi:hypothetical protein
VRLVGNSSGKARKVFHQLFSDSEGQAFRLVVYFRALYREFDMVGLLGFVMVFFFVSFFCKMSREPGQAL